MQVSVVDQPGAEQLADRFIGLLRAPETTRFLVASAWAQEPALRVLGPDLKAFAERVRPKDCRGLFGVDLRGTSREALELACELFGNVRVFHSKGFPRRTFHPKLYLFEQEDRSIVSIGSSNLTVGGLWGNFETGVVIELRAGDSDDDSFLKEVHQWYEAHWGDPGGSIRVTAKAIEALEADPEIRLPTERERRQLLVPPRSAGRSDGNSAFPKPVEGLLPLPSIPSGVGSSGGEAGDPALVPALPISEIETPADQAELKVLAAGIPRDRWKQIGFNKTITDEFFHVDVNGGSLWVEPVKQDGTVDPPRETRLIYPAGSNKNHRIELPEPDGRSDPRPQWAIVLVLERSFRTFRYMSLRPGDSGYSKIQAEIARRPSYGTTLKPETKRVLLSYGELQKIWPGTCPLQP